MSFQATVNSHFNLINNSIITQHRMRFNLFPTVDRCLFFIPQNTNLHTYIALSDGSTCTAGWCSNLPKTRTLNPGYCSFPSLSKLLLIHQSLSPPHSICSPYLPPELYRWGDRERASPTLAPISYFLSCLFTSYSCVCRCSSSSSPDSETLPIQCRACWETGVLKETVPSG